MVVEEDVETMTVGVIAMTEDIEVVTTEEVIEAEMIGEEGVTEMIVEAEIVILGTLLI